MAQVLSNVSSPLAAALFGDDAFVEDGVFLHRHVKDFIDAFVVNMWHRYRKGLTREGRVIEQNRYKLDTAWTGEYITVIFYTLRFYSISNRNPDRRIQDGDQATQVVS